MKSYYQWVFLKRIHLHSQVIPCLRSYSILLIYCFISPSPIQPDSSMKKTSKHSSGWCYRESDGPRSGDHGSVSSGLVCVAETPKSKLLVSVSARGSLSRAALVWRGQDWDHRPSPRPFPLVVRWPSCCAAPAFATCCLQMPKSWALRCLIPKPCLKQPSQPHRNAFKIAVWCQPLCWKKHLSLGQKASSLGIPGTWMGTVLPSLSGKGTGLGWSPVRLDPAAYSHLKSFPGRDTAFFLFYFFPFPQLCK